MPQTSSHNHPRLTLRTPTIQNSTPAQYTPIAQQQHQRQTSREYPPSKSPSYNTSASGHSSSPAVQQQQYAARPISAQNNSSSVQSSPPIQQQPQPQYPLPIAPDKLPRAVELYGKFRMVRALAQRERERGHLPVPGRAPSVASYASSGNSPVSPSHGRTESVLSFDRDESPSSAMANASNEFTAYNGAKVKTRKRDKLNPEAKAKAALIRHLGSCWVCRARRVPCPLDHHDEAALESGLRERNSRRQIVVQPVNRPFRASTSPQPSHSLLEQNPEILGRSVSQRNPQTRTPNPELAFLGQDFNPAVGFQSPIYAPDIMDPLASIDAQSQYTQYRDGQMFLIGIIRQNLFECQHLVAGGRCNQRFRSPDELQSHFETLHFAFTRINPCHRFHCFGCEEMCDPNQPCPQCGLPGLKEVRIYGNYIRSQQLNRFLDDGSDLFSFDDYNNNNLFSAGGLSPDAEFGLGNPDFGGANFGDLGQSDYQNNNNNTYTPGSGSQHSGFDAGDAPQQGRFQCQSHQFANSEEASPIPSRGWFQTFQQDKPPIFVIAILLSLTFTIANPSHFIGATKAISSHLDEPITGFAFAVTSFVLSHTIFCSIKHPPSEFQVSLVLHSSRRLRMLTSISAPHGLSLPDE